MPSVEVAPSATWTSDDTLGAIVEVPDDGSVTLGLSNPFTQEVPLSRSSRLSRDGEWVATVGIGPGASLTVTAPTQPLADVVASTVRSTD